MNKYLSRITLLVLLLLIMAVPGQEVWAHANLVRSTPGQGSAQPTSPPVFVLDFSEPLDREFTNIEVTNLEGDTVVEGPGEVDPDNDWRLFFEPGDLPDGTYSVLWYVRSSVDGHITSGTIGFSVGDSPPASPLPALGEPLPAEELPVPFDVLVRWISYVAAALSVGGVFFGLLVWIPAYQTGFSTEADKRVVLFIKRQIRVGVLVLMGATILFLIVQAVLASSAGGGLPALDTVVSLLTARTGALLTGRIALLVAVLLLVSQLRGAAEKSPVMWYVSALLCAGVLVTFSLQSHGAALNSPVATIAVWLHILTASIWVGGLTLLWLSLRWLKQNKQAGVDLVRRFSWVALVTVGLLVYSGIVNGLLHVKNFEALTSTVYGWELVVKVVVFAIVIVFAALNLAAVRIGLPNLVHRVVRHVPVEIAGALVILLAAGALTATPPALEALMAQQRLGLVDRVSEDDVDLTMWVAPGQVGDNEFGIDIFDERPNVERVEPQVLLRFRRPGDPFNETQIETDSQDGIRYRANGSFLSEEGIWEIEVILRRRGFNDVRHTFEVDAMAINPVTPTNESIIEGRLIYLEACAPCHGESGLGDGPAAASFVPRPANLTQHAAPGIHSDDELFDWISNGLPWSEVMPAFGDVYTTTERWHLINYLRTLEP